VRRDEPAAGGELAFAGVYCMLERRIGIFVNLPIRSLDELTLRRRLDDIGCAEHLLKPA
jgi:arsenate reductase (thioredoxin)